jgi:hypothetical protein
MNEWKRTCQECDTVVLCSIPPNYLESCSEHILDAWLFKKCRKCKSESLDYGMLNLPEEEDEE